MSQTGRTVARNNEPLERIVLACAVLLLVIRMLVPAESSVHGGTLWIVQGWLGLLGLWLWLAVRQGELTLRWGWADSLFWLVVTGHVVSAASVVLGQGDRRAAVNMAWEWIALGVALFVVRQLFVRRADCRDLLALAVVLGMSCAAWGIWQHYVWYPQMAEEYRVALEPAAVGPSTPSAAQSERIAAMRRQLVASGVSLEGEGQRSLEDRLLSSREPFGPHALANTFGGLLSVWLILAVGLRQRGAQSFLQSSSTGKLLHLVWMAGIAVLGFCLLLTKSRTAWIGCLIAALAVAVSLAARRRLRRAAGAEPGESRTGVAWRRLLLILLLISFGTIGLFASGSLDRQVLSEAGKSFSYRIQYWEGSWQALAKHPWLGAGPGNFRQSYLEFKQPESSEEIADPHNWFLDVWSSGGLLALGGALGLLVLAIRSWSDAVREWPHSVRETAGNQSDGATRSPTIVAGFLIAFALLLFKHWLWNEWSWQLPAVASGWFVLWTLLRSTFPERRLDPLVALAALLALTVHLLGAGGIEMPGVVEMGMLVAVCGVAAALEQKKAAGEQPRAIPLSTRTVLPLGMLVLILFGACLLTATRPVLLREASVQQGDLQVLDGRLRAAMSSYAEAAAADPLSPEPLWRMAELQYQSWAESPAAVDRELQQAVELGELAWSADPLSSLGPARLGQWCLERAQRNDAAPARDWAERAVSYFRAATKRYPTNADLLAQLAQAAAAAGQDDEARAAARSALQQDELNHQYGHADKYLPDAVRAELVAMCEDGMR